ncbi:MAG: glycosyltransferase family 9 protein [Fimbriimonadaceae bacterium]
MEKPVSRILIIARDMVGDLVNTTGAVLQVRRKFPDAHITLEGGPPVAEVFANWPKQLEVWIRERGGGPQRKLKRIQRMKRGRFDLCLVFDDGHSHARLAKVAGIPRRIGVHRGNPNVYTISKPFDEAGHDLFDTLIFVLQQISIDATLNSVRPTLFPSEVDEQIASDGLSKLGAEPIGLNVSSTAIEKNWPDERWDRLLELGAEFNFVMLGMPGEDLSRFGANQIEQPMSILQFACFLKGLRAVVTPDTGTAHLAAAMGTPCLVLYGPTRYERFHPFPARDHACTGIKSEIESFGCNHYGAGCAQKTADGHCSRACMLAISPEQALMALTELLRAR